MRRCWRREEVQESKGPRVPRFRLLIDFVYLVHMLDLVGLIDKLIFIIMNFLIDLVDLLNLE